MCRVGSQPTRGLCHPRASGKPAFSPRPPANWVRFAQSHSGGAPRPRLPAPIPGRAGQIGFVLRICPASRAPAATSHPTRRELGSFCTSTLRPGQIGFVLHGPHGLATLIHFSKNRIYVHFSLSQIGFVSHVSLPGRPRPTRRPPLPTYPIRPKFGFVLRNFLRQPPAAGRNWVRFAHFASETCLRPGQIGFVLRIYPPAPAPERPDWVCSAHFASGPSCLTLDSSNLKLSPRKIIECPFSSWDWHYSLLMTVSDHRRRRRAHFYI
jgi:hypothetical protein